MRTIKQLALAAALVVTAPAVLAQDVRITTFKDESTFTLNGRSYAITRNQDTAATLQGEFARTSRACPPDCLQPMSLADGVGTFGELEIIAFLENTVADGTGLLLDARAPADFARGSIPGAVNVPFTTLAENNRFRGDILRALGAVPRSDGTLDFTNAMALTLFSGGVWSADAPTAIRNLVSAGYPPEKLSYYRGGMQAWVHVGLSVQFPQNPG